MSIDNIIEKVYKVISSVFISEVGIETTSPEFRNYPYSTAWKWHNEYINYIMNRDISYLTLPTGTGKTVVYLTAAIESRLSTLVVTPRNGLQEQVAQYSSVFNYPILYLFQRGKHCNKRSGKVLPCYRKFRRQGKWYFKLNGEVVEFPCEDCPYESRKNTIRELFKKGECVAVMNQGNFWMLRADAEFVVIDEADETLRAIVQAVSYPKRYESNDPVDVLEWMKTRIESNIDAILKMLEVEKDENNLQKLNMMLDKLENKLRKVNFFLSYDHEKLITYVKGNKTYVEIFDDMHTITKRLFGHAEKICVVTATPSSSVHSDGITIPFRARVIYVPLENMSVRRLKSLSKEERERVFDRVAKFIIKTYDYAVMLTGMNKAPIHCGNLHMHGTYLYNILRANGQKVILMEKGNQVNSVKEFLNKDYDFFCAVSIEHGFDWGFSPIQYIVKVPFADLGDPRIRAIKKLLGDKFDRWLNEDAMHRLIQASGRNARDPNDFGITIILDKTFERVYERLKDKIPNWFQERLVWLKVNGNAQA